MRLEIQHIHPNKKRLYLVKLRKIYVYVRAKFNSVIIDRHITVKNAKVIIIFCERKTQLANTWKHIAYSVCYSVGKRRIDVRSYICSHFLESLVTI